MHFLVGKVKRFLQSFACTEGMVVAVSGGPDSVALLRLLLELTSPPPTLVIAHLNHQLRGAESDADEAFVRHLHAASAETAATRLELRCEKIDVAARAKAEDRKSTRL